MIDLQGRQGSAHQGNNVIAPAALEHSQGADKQQSSPSVYARRWLTGSANVQMRQLHGQAGDWVALTLCQEPEQLQAADMLYVAASASASAAQSAASLPQPGRKRLQQWNLSAHAPLLAGVRHLRKRVNSAYPFPSSSHIWCCSSQSFSTTRRAGWSPDRQYKKLVFEA